MIISHLLHEWCFFHCCPFPENFPDKLFCILFLFKHDFLHTFLVIWKVSRQARKRSIFYSEFERKYILIDIMPDSYRKIYIICTISIFGWVACMMGFLTKDAKYVKKQMLLGHDNEWWPNRVTRYAEHISWRWYSRKEI